jgi:hypothetical protein
MSAAPLKSPIGSGNSWHDPDTHSPLILRLLTVALPPPTKKKKPPPFSVGSVPTGKFYQSDGGHPPYGP